MEKELERPDSDGEGGGGGSQEGKEGRADGETEEEVKRSPKCVYSSFAVQHQVLLFIIDSVFLVQVFYEL